MFIADKMTCVASVLDSVLIIKCSSPISAYSQLSAGLSVVTDQQGLVNVWAMQRSLRASVCRV